jgi:hypothetical protein
MTAIGRSILKSECSWPCVMLYLPCLVVTYVATVSLAQSMQRLMTGRLISHQLEKNVDGSGRGLTWGTIPLFSRRCKKLQSIYLLPEPRFDHDTLRILSKGVNHSTMWLQTLCPPPTFQYNGCPVSVLRPLLLIYLIRSVFRAWQSLFPSVWK